jgi:hypothetical protein
MTTNYIMDERVGYGATSILEAIVKEYIVSNTVNGKYVGDLHYLTVCESLHKYNTGD